MPHFEGGCHCGNLAYVFEATAGLETLGLRACQCSFCRGHNARTTSDPGGSVRITVREPGELSRYRFSLKTADFLICRRCGVFIGALLTTDGQSWVTLNANTFKPPPPADHPLVPHDFGREDAHGRIVRRQQKWTPVVSFET
jgi:hypothetical protein